MKQNEAKMSKRSMYDWWLLDCEVLKTNRKVKSGPARNKPEGFENGGLSQRLGLPSTLIRYEKGAFRKLSANQRNLKTLTIRFCVGENILKTELFGKHDVTMITWSPSRSFPQTQIQHGRWLLGFQIPTATVVWPSTENTWCVFRVERPFSDSSSVVRRGLISQFKTWVSNNALTQLSNHLSPNSDSLHSWFNIIR